MIKTGEIKDAKTIMLLQYALISDFRYHDVRIARVVPGSLEDTDFQN